MDTQKNQQNKKNNNNSDPKLLNIVCGSNQLIGWLNTDFTPDNDNVIFIDSTQKQPLDSTV